MQAVIALCYFCENHVMTCQPMRGSNSQTDNPCRFHADEAMETDAEIPQYYGDTIDEIVDEEERCSACSSFGSGLGILSNDHQAETSYISTQMPISERLYQMIKQSCLRSLSVEISTPLFVETGSHDFASTSNAHLHVLSTSRRHVGVDRNSSKEDKDGVVLFGDDENGYTLSMTFRLRDAKARGFNRSYSLIVLSRDKLMLLNNYEFFLGGFSAIISRLQAMAKSFFVMEQELDDNNLRLVTNVNRTDRAQWLPHQFYPKNFVLDTSRCLSVITNNRDIFTIIHRQMLYLLKTQTTLAHDIVLEGVPSQDMLVIMEMEQNTLEENDLVTSHSTNTAPQTPAPPAQSPCHSHKVCGHKPFIAKHAFVASCGRWTALGNLLPVGCIRLASNSSNYVHNYKANFLGCLNEICIPEEVFNEVFVIKIQPRESSTEYSEENLEDFDFFVEKCSQRDGPKPSLLLRYIELLLDPVVNVSTLDVALKAIRCDWQNNAKLIFQLRHQKEGIDISKIIKIIKCGTQDSPVLLFWQSGLSRRYKQVVLNTINTGKCSNRRIDFGNGQ